VFFASGALWSIVGVMLWPLFYAQWIGFHPGMAHARIMIEVFGGAFVVGFLGTAGPRMASAPKLMPVELLWLFGLHQTSALCHLTLHLWWGEICFIALLASLVVMLVIRVVKFRKEPPPPQMLLALTGLGCGMVGATMLLNPMIQLDAGNLRLANLLLYQGLLLPPVLGIGSFVFPRMLGGDFGEPKTAAQMRAGLVRAVVTAALLVCSFVMETKGQVMMGYALRTLAAVGYLFIEVKWVNARRGSLTTGLFWSLALGALGLVLAPLHYAQHVAIEHLLYIGGFGLLMLIVGSRVLFGHSGELEGFFTRSKWVRFLVFLGVLAATTRAVPAVAPSTTVSHHIYAALTWALLATCWLMWHRRRLVKRDEE